MYEIIFEARIQTGPLQNPMILADCCLGRSRPSGPKWPITILRPYGDAAGINLKPRNLAATTCYKRQFSLRKIKGLADPYPLRQIKNQTPREGVAGFLLSDGWASGERDERGARNARSRKPRTRGPITKSLPSSSGTTT